MKIMNQKSENQNEPISQNSGEDRLARHGFFLNDDFQGSTEGEQLAGQLADIFKSMQEKPPFDSANSDSEPPSNPSPADSSLKCPPVNQHMKANS